MGRLLYSCILFVKKKAKNRWKQIIMKNSPNDHCSVCHIDESGVETISHTELINEKG